MTKEDKELLLQDLCSRLPYEVKALFFDAKKGYISVIEGIDIYKFIKDDSGMETEISDVKPYLFPMSSMTDEQREEYRKVCELDTEILSKHPMDGTPFPALYYSQDWLNKNHFDYRGLIPMGLVIDATNKNIY